MRVEIQNHRHQLTLPRRGDGRSAERGNWGGALLIEFPQVACGVLAGETARNVFPSHIRRGFAIIGITKNKALHFDAEKNAVVQWTHDPTGQRRYPRVPQRSQPLSGLARVVSLGQGPVAVLNFASAKNPGGGFLNGSQAQEESLARSSALHASQMRAWDFYASHRASSSLLYSEAMILSPGCPFFRDDEGRLLDEPLLAEFITSAAPNAGAGAGANSRPEELPSIPGVFRRRSEYVLALAASQGYRQQVLGAWGCGVFRNDPSLVARSFADHLLHGNWSGRFDRVVFSVLDTSPEQATFRAFWKALGGSGRGGG